jgi:hypothetical protein
VQIRALVVTRDDFWTGAKELLHWLELPLQEGRNVASLDLLDPAHAERILEALGRENGTLPPDGQPLSNQQSQFLAHAVEELTVDGSVISIHLVMFAHMLKLQKWTPRALRQSGGVSGACSMFFQELFAGSGRHWPEYHRVLPAVATIMPLLLPKADDSVAGTSASRAELVAAAQAAGHAHLLDDCLRLLSEDLRIVTVMSSQSADSDSAEELPQVATHPHRYRLAHDFLVEPIHVFLARLQQSTWRGRNQSRLSELSEVWSRRPINAYLPGFFEYVSLLLGTGLQKHSDTEVRFLRAAARKHAGRISAALVALIAFLLVSIFAWTQWSSARTARRQELAVRLDAFLNTAPAALDERMRDLQDFDSAALAEVSAWQDSIDADSRLRARIYLQSADPQSLGGIAPLLHLAAPEFFDPVLRVAAQTEDSADQLRQTANDASNPKNADRAAILLAYLGDNSLLINRLSGSNDAARDQAFLLETRSWRGSPQLWADLVSNHANPQVRYHAGLVLGGYSPAELNQGNLTFDFANLINSTDAVVHSIGGFLASHLGEDAFEIPRAPPPGANWKLGPDSIPMVRLEPANFTYEESLPAYRTTESRTVGIEVEQPLWFAMLPVSQRLYNQFAASGEPLPDGSSAAVSLDGFDVPEHLTADDRQPTIGTNLTQAYAFCNWLSRREGLAECYRFTAAQPVIAQRDSFTMEPVPWEVDLQANGYRLPTNDEFQLAVLCEYPNGLPWQYAKTIASQSGAAMPRPLFEVAPSRFGVFLYDQGTWITVTEEETRKSVLADGLHAGLGSRDYGVPSTMIFLVQSAAELN